MITLGQPFFLARCLYQIVAQRRYGSLHLGKFFWCEAAGVRRCGRVWSSILWRAKWRQSGTAKYRRPLARPPILDQ